MSKDKKLVPKLRFPEFRNAPGWQKYAGSGLFDQINNRDASTDLPVLAITQEHGAIPRELIDYHVSVTEQSLGGYKVVNEGDFIISLRSFQGGIEYSRYHGICSPAYVILRLRGKRGGSYFRHYLKTEGFIRLLTRNLEGLRDGKMISYKQFSELGLPVPSETEQKKIADCLSSLDELITAQARKVEALEVHKNGLMQQLFPCEGETLPRLRSPSFRDRTEWQIFKIGDLVDEGWLYPPRDGNHGNIHPKSSDYVPEGIPFIMASDLRNGKIDIKGCHFIRRELADSLRKGFAKEGDVLLSHKGTVGAVAIVPAISMPYLMLTPQVTYFRVRNKEKLSNAFLAHLFCTPVFQTNLLKASGGGTRSYIGILEQANLLVTLPRDIDEQQWVANSLGRLDDQIAAQRQQLDALRLHKDGLMQRLFPLTSALEA